MLVESAFSGKFAANFTQIGALLYKL